MSLSRTQQDFAQHIAELIQYIREQGYECTFGDAFRDPRSHGAMGESGPYGRRESAHKQRLAVDLNLFKDGHYLPSTEAHRPFGEFWKGIHPDNVWGGDFDDGNHYSRRYGGIA